VKPPAGYANDLPKALVDEAKGRFREAHRGVERTNHLPPTAPEREEAIRRFRDAGAVAVEVGAIPTRKESADRLRKERPV
jgi:hypothetical protein